MKDNVAVSSVKPPVVALIHLDGVEVLNLPHCEARNFARVIREDFLVFEIRSLQSVEPSPLPEGQQ